MIGKTKETLTRPKMTKAEREAIEQQLEQFKGWAADIEETNGQTDTYYHQQVKRLTKALADSDAGSTDKGDNKDEVTS